MVNISIFRTVSWQIHLSLVVFLGLFSYSGYQVSTSWSTEIAAAIAAFGFFLVHDLGHIAGAGIAGVKDIRLTMFPFGSICEINGKSTATQEAITLLGGTGASLVASLLLLFWQPAEVLGLTNGSGIIERLFLLNLAIGLGNLLPIAPLDGGQLLQRLQQGVSTTLPQPYNLGMAAILFATTAIDGHPLLSFATLMVLFTAAQAQIMARTHAAALPFCAADAAVPLTNLQTFPHGTTLQTAVLQVVRSWQEIFPVVLGEQVIGLLNRTTILQQASIDSQRYISEIMERNCERIPADLSLSTALKYFDGAESQVMLVMSAGKELGLLTREKIFEFLMLQRLQARRALQTFDDDD